MRRDRHDLASKIRPRLRHTFWLLSFLGVALLVGAVTVLAPRQQESPTWRAAERPTQSEAPRAHEPLAARATGNSAQEFFEESVTVVEADSESREAPSAEEPRELARAVAGLAVEEAYALLYEVASDPERTREERASLHSIAAGAGFDAKLRGLALWGLAAVGELGPSEAALASGGSTELRLTAVEMLRRHGGRGTWDRLSKVAAAKGDVSVRESALRAAFDLERDRSFQLLAASLQSDAPASLQLAALELLGERHDQDSLAAVLSYRPLTDPARGALRQATALLALRSVDPIEVEAALGRLASDGGLSRDVRGEIERMRRRAGLSDWDLGECGQGS